MKSLPCIVAVICLVAGSQVFADEPAAANSLKTSPSSTQPLPAPSKDADAIPQLKSNPSSVTAIKNPVLKKPRLPESSSLLPQLFQVALALLFVLGLIIGSAWLFRRFGQTQYSVKGNFRVLGGVHLSTREKVVLLQLGEQQLLLGVAPGRVNILHVLEQPLDLNSPTPVTESAFAKRLASLIQGKNP